jgi:hypothetical protein
MPSAIPRYWQRCAGSRIQHRRESIFSLDNFLPAQLAAEVADKYHVACIREQSNDVMLSVVAIYGV